MRDGVRLAVDLHLPEGAVPAGGRPAILRQTRYYRALEPGAVLARLGLPFPFDVYRPTRRLFLEAGYAVVEVDVRGSGASGGTQPYPWTPDEIRDGAEVVDWIVGQEWSSGRVGSIGVSYDGTCAEHLLALRHPAVRAIIPMFSLFDAYADVGFPGGIHLSWFTDVWARLNMLLDHGRFDEAMAHALWACGRSALLAPQRGPRTMDRVLGAMALAGRPAFSRMVRAITWPLQRGVRRVDGDDGRLIAAAVAEHAANLSVHELACEVVHRDDTLFAGGPTPIGIDGLSPHRAHERAGGPLEGTATFSVSGWRDGGYPAAAIRRWLRWPGPRNRLTIGPWVHGGLMTVRPFAGAIPSTFDFPATALEFFDEHLRDRPANGKPVNYYTMVEGRWKTASAWPPPEFAPAPLWIGADGALSGRRGEAGAEHPHPVDRTHGTGERSRWRSLTGLVPGDYPDRAARGRKLLVYESAPLAHDLEVTGHPLAVLFAAWDGARDGQVFVYLEDADGDGRVAYVTEGQLRALHRRTRGEDLVPGLPGRTFLSADAAALGDGEIAELAVPLLPISWLFRAGHRVRLAIAGADADHFTLPDASAQVMRVFAGPRHPSRIELPVSRPLTDL
jgi:putative CocE/NonD family hydrolase